QDLSLSQRDAGRCKNFFAFGLMYWLYNRPLEPTLTWIDERFRGGMREANRRLLLAGDHFLETSELYPVSVEVPLTQIEPGVYRTISGNPQLAWGVVAASVRMHPPVFLDEYPTTPASDVLHELGKHLQFGVKTSQAEDEIAAASSAVGAAFAGMLAMTVT